MKPDLDPFVSQAAREAMSFVIEACVSGTVRVVLLAVALAFLVGFLLGRALS
jgi:uncharacterized Tic20 family protein